MYDDVTVGCDTMWTCRQLPVFQKTYCIHIQGSPTSPHDITSQESNIVIFIAMRPSDLTQKCMIVMCSLFITHRVGLSNLMLQVTLRVRIPPCLFYPLQTHVKRNVNILSNNKGMGLLLENINTIFYIPKNLVHFYSRNSQ